MNRDGAALSVPTDRIAHLAAAEGCAALRDFDPTYDRSGQKRTYAPRQPAYGLHASLDHLIWRAASAAAGEPKPQREHQTFGKRQTIEAKHWRARRRS